MDTTCVLCRIDDYDNRIGSLTRIQAHTIYVQLFNNITIQVRDLGASLP
jgi:hypothetical protein